MANIIDLTVLYVPDPTAGRPIPNGNIYIGEPGLDPEIPANQKQVTSEDETGTPFNVTQPIKTTAGGVPIQGVNVLTKLLVDDDYSVKITDSLGSQIYYVANAADITIGENFFVFDTVSDMIAATNLSVGDVVITAGYATSGDGGDNTYEIVAGGTGIDDGGSFIDLTASGFQAKGLFYGGKIKARQFGAIGDASADDTTAIQAALDFISGGGEIYLSSGSYRTTSALIFRNSNVSLRGDGVNATTILCDGDGLEIRRDTYLDGDTINEVGLHNFSFFRKGDDATGYDGIIERLSIGTIITNVTMYDFPFGHRKLGCKNTNHFRYRILSGTAKVTTVTDTFGILFGFQQLADLSEETGFTHIFDQSFITSNLEAMDNGLIFQAADVVQFSNSYIARQEDSAIKFVGIPANPKSATAITFQNTYFDGVMTAEQRTAIKIQSSSDLTIKDLVFDNCQFGQYKDVFSSTSANIEGLVIRGQAFNITNQFAFFSNATSVILDLTGYNLNSDGNPIGNVVFSDCGLVDCAISVSRIKGDDLIRLFGTTDTLNIRTISLRDSTITNLVLQSSTVSNYVNTGTKLPFTPELTIGGSTTGITYTARAGEFSIVNRVMHFKVYVALSSKGAQTGDVEISVPVVPRTNTIANIINAIANDVNINNTGVYGQITDLDTEMKLRYATGTGSAILSEADINNNSLFIIEGSLYVS